MSDKKKLFIRLSFVGQYNPDAVYSMLEFGDEKSSLPKVEIEYDSNDTIRSLLSRLNIPGVKKEKILQLLNPEKQVFDYCYWNRKDYSNDLDLDKKLTDLEETEDSTETDIPRLFLGFHTKGKRRKKSPPPVPTTQEPPKPRFSPEDNQEPQPTQQVNQDFSGPIVAPGANFGLQTDPGINSNPNADQNTLPPPIPEVKKEITDETRKNDLAIYVHAPVHVNSEKDPNSKLDFGANEIFKKKSENFCKFLFCFYLTNLNI